MPASSPLKVALVGYGYVGKTFHAPLIVATPGLTLRAVVSSDPAKVAADLPDARVAPDLAEALADPAIDLVVIATPNALHAPQAIAALNAGKHVVVDKPFALSAAEARTMAETARAAGKLLTVFHNRRWDSDFLTVKRLIADGTLGEVVQFESHFDRFRPVVRDRWRERAGPGAGAWMDLGPHLLDQALVLFGEPLAVTADIGVQRPGAGADDYFHVVLRYPTLRVILHGSLLTAASDLRLAVHGTGGSFVKHGLDPQEAQLKAGMVPGAPGWGRDSRHGVLTTVENDAQVHADVSPEPADYRAFYAGVREATLHGAPSPVPVEEGLRVMDLLELARRASEARRELTV
ncbi:MULTISPECIES: oxidoreductase [unclassified Caulobacter]|uniref:oxidoreductase n=1 Tax=unclassified Caulobacter TaxID=2648921 RepID=UPI0006FDEA8D|nr:MULTISPECIES: oxidoreductase [unclassified Caulobacter]KQV56843.1 oxidoreductase [Caulobacter sp. Root342]KQV72482.1 oxidoreductase [Caulobacter sp. Root343]